MGYVKVAPRDCLGCGISLHGYHGTAKRCEPCRREEYNRRRKERWHYPQIEVKCQQCGQTVRRLARTSRDARRFCSRRCAGQHRSSREQIASTHREHCRAGYRLHPCEGACGGAVGPGRRRCLPCRKQIERQLKWERKYRGRVHTCVVCGAQYCNLIDRNDQNTTCSDEHAKELRREQKGASKRRRRARKRASTVETVVRTRVFERDGWQCQSCGCETPRGLMGTLDDNAPELDHVVPLAKGGAHSYVNTQCLCRACNLLKADNDWEKFLEEERGGRSKILQPHLDATACLPFFCVSTIDL